jgi:hypothetical protein
MFLVSFFVFLGMAYFRDSISAESTPGIEEMQRPHFSFSPIYLAWLFVNDRERWANYATILSCLGAVAVSPALGFIFFVVMRVSADPSLPFASWLSGIVWMVATALEVKRRISVTGTEENNSPDEGVTGNIEP